MAKKRVALGAAYSAIEPLGLLHLGGLARDEGWDREYILVKDHDYEPFFKFVKAFKPDVVGFTVYTGNDRKLHEAFKRLKQDFPSIQTIVGGYHPTYFPEESLGSADFVVMSEGFNSFRKILRGQAKPGIMPLTELETFPFPDRETFYKEYPEHARSKIKSMITMTGCPYGCTYCYNSSTLKELKISPEVAAAFIKQGMGERLFPQNIRNLDSILREGREINERWPAETIYFQDDVFGFDDKVGGFLDQFSETWPEQVGIPFHYQMRWEMTKSDKRLDLIKKAGASGATHAIEAADPEMRKKILDRHMDDEVVFDGMEKLMKLGLKVRTEQITGLPWGITSNITSMNLDADLEMLEYNIRLRRVTGGPTMAWASTLVPYLGTKIYNICEEFGFYQSDNSDIKDSFFDRSVLRFMKEWMGPRRAKLLKDDPSIWLPQDELERYRDQNAELRRKFNLFALIPEGHILARNYLTQPVFTNEKLSEMTLAHLRNLPNNGAANEMLTQIDYIHSLNGTISNSEQEKTIIGNLAPYFGSLPKGDLAAQRFLEYGRRKGYLPNVLADATRHHLYDNVLYSTSKDDRPHELSTPRQSTLK